MALESGIHLTVYEILEPLGAGGIGEVYRARDTKLGREVAIKVLPDELAGDRERLDRFEREARPLAALNHSAIAHLYGFEEDDGTSFIVMELVEGETLAERIAAARLSVAEALPLFTQIAEGLDAAHHKGVIHRDLKPANIKITPDGKPKILDFGLAKAFLREEDVSAETSQSPTLTKNTALGTIMGTASYMSPEQARGKHVDKRTDIWAFACCLYESLTGKKAFDGDTVNDIIAAVVNKEPRWEQLPATTPRTLRVLLRRCLEKDARRRLHDIADARLELASRHRRCRELSTGICGVCSGGQRLARGPQISPDGRFMAYVSNESGRDEVDVRPLNESGRATCVSVSGGKEPLWSRDGRELFYRNGKAMMSIPVDTNASFTAGAPVTLFERRYNTYILSVRPNYAVSADGQTFFMIRSGEESSPRIHVVVDWGQELESLVTTAN